MADIRFSNIRKQFGDGTVALESFSLEIPSPRLVVLVGPSGCGKTTLLRLIAGLERPTAGEIFLGESRLDTLDPRDRDVAMVFQNYALYPHMTVRENLSFGLRIRKTPRPEVDARVSEVARSLEIDSLLGRRPAELSGGQRQRVALGRAIIREPRVFLFDEPLSNLDARLRDEMRYLIKRLYQRLGTTTLYVTHDQVEAMTIGEMLVVMRSGRIHQVGTPTECYERPADRFVASFLGSPPMNFLEATLEIDRGVAQVSGGTPVPVPDAVREGLRGERRVVIGIRPEHLMIPGERCEFSLEGRVALRETLGHDTLTHVDVAGGTVIVRGRRAPAEGAVRLGIPLEHVHYFSAVGGGRLAADGPGA